MINSPANPFVKAVAQLRKRRGREHSGQILIDGHRALELALAAGVGVVDVCLRENAPREAVEAAQRAETAGARVTLLGERAFARVAYGDAPDTVVAVAERPETALESLDDLGPSPLLAVVEGVEKPGNLGAVLRTADAVGADAVLVADPVTDPFGPNTIRASRGTVFSLPLVAADGATMMAWLKARSIRLLAATPGANKNYTDTDMTGPLAIAVGAEHQGLSELWLEGADKVVIPMRGQADSLNLSASLAVLLYEALRQRDIR